jgi:PAS domain S-box-containing protein
VHGTYARVADPSLCLIRVTELSPTAGNASPPPLQLAPEQVFRLLVEGVTDYAIFMLDPDGHVASWNPGAERLKGYKREEIVGRHFSTFYTREANDRAWPQHELDVAKRDGRFEDEGWRVRKDGTMFWANVVITALRDKNGRLQGFAKITRDLSERRSVEQRLRESEEGFRLLLEGVEDYAIFMLDPEGRVTSWNAGAQRITGYAAGEIIGHSFERFFLPADVAAGRPANELRDAMLSRRSEDRGWRVRKDGSRFWAEAVVTSLRDESGRMRGFAKVVRDMSDRKRIESLEQQGRHLTEFLAMLAHELRNPLAPISNAAAIIAASEQGNARVRWAREVIERQAAHLTRMVDDLLDVSRITRGKLRLKSAPVDLADTVRGAVDSSRALLEGRGHRLHMDIAAKPVWVNADVTRLTQVVLNLLNNAAKYTPEGGDVWVKLEVIDGEVQVSVRDSGVGIPAQMIEGIFDLFAQGERTLDRSEGGLGIGLTLARRIVALHGGTIKAESPGPGEGSTFTVTLPRLDLRTAEGDPKGTITRLPERAAQRRVLVVDDNTDAASSIAMLLRMHGQEVDVVERGREAIERLATLRPDIILLDIGLPDVSGYEVAREARRLPGGDRIRIYALTGYGQQEDRARTIEAGFDGHLVKPIAPADLVALVVEPDPPG